MTFARAIEHDLAEAQYGADPLGLARAFARRQGVGFGRRSGFRITGGGGGGGTPRDNVLALAFNGDEHVDANANTLSDVDEVSFGNAAAFSSSSNNRSCSFWVFPIKTSGTNTIIAHWDWGTAQGGWAVSTTGASSDKLQVRFSNTTGTDTLAGTMVTDNSVLTVGAWNHVVIVYDGAGGSQTLRCMIYVNGVLITARTPSGTIPATLITSSTSRVRLGRWNGQATGTATPCEMLIRDTRVWGGTAIGQSDVDALYSGTGSFTAPTSHWALNGDLLDDVSTNHGSSTPAAPAGPHFVMRTQTWPTPGGYRVLAQGDSITAGSGFPGAWRLEFVAHLWHRYGKRVQMVGRYVDTTTPADFLAKYPNHSGLSGQKIGADGASGMRGEIETDIANYSPNLIINLSGTNDIASDGTTSAQTRDRLGSWIDEARAVTSVPIHILGTPRRNDAFDATCTGYDDLLAALAAGKTDVTFTDACREMSPLDMQSGSAQHPGNVGARKIGAKVAQAVQALIP